MVKMERFIPFFKITDITITQNLLEQLLRLSRVIVQTAGTGAKEVPEILFEGLEKPSEPVKILRRLLAKHQKAGGKKTEE